MGEVYKARDTRLDRTVEIKILPESLAADPQFREQFDRDVIRVTRWGFEPPLRAIKSIIEEDDYGFD
jgi:serine/threonine protein kinase